MRPFDGTLLLLLAGASGCTSEGPDSDSGGGEGEEKIEFACEIGTWTGSGGFVPFGSDATFELQMGFQGFLLVAVNLRTEEEGFTLGNAVMSVKVEGADTISGAQPAVGVHDGVSDTILIFFTANYLSYYVDRSADVAVRLEDATRFCVVPVTGTLVDEDPCIHTGSEPICPEDTGP